MTVLIRNDSALGHVLREHRRRRGLTQAALGRKAGLRQKTVSDVELGRGASTRTIFALLAALGLELRVAEREVGVEPPVF